MERPDPLPDQGDRRELPETEKERPLFGGERKGLSLLAFVALALLLLAAIDMFVEARLEPRQETIVAVAEPALAVTSDIQLTLARQMSGLRAYLLGGEARFLDRYQSLRQQQATHFEQLASLVVELGPGVVSRSELLRTAVQDWNQWIDGSGVLVREDPPPDYVRRLPLEEGLYDSALEASLELEDGIRESTAALRAEISRWEEIGRSLSFVLLVLALAAAGGVALIGRRLRGLNEDLHQRRIDLERVTRSRARLLRGFSHDLKNPLGAADGHAALLESGVIGTLEPRQADSVRRIRATLRSAFLLIDDLVELGRAETAGLDIRSEPVDVEGILKDLADEYRPQASASDLELTVEVPEQLPILRTDRARMEQVLSNLLSNAVKYTEKGSIRLRARIERQGVSRSGNHLHIDVVDTGLGIPDERSDLLFREFTRLHTAGRPGAGVGLAISSRIARALGGEITVRSKEGVGSTFTLTLPLEGPPRSEVPASLPPGPEPASSPGVRGGEVP